MAPLRSSAVSLVVSYVVFLLLSSVAIVFRFISIHILRRDIKAHDILCLVSLICLIAYAIDTLIGTVDGGIGMHIDKVPLPQLKIGLKTFFASEFFWATSISAFRLSILLLYIEIFAVPAFRLGAYGSGFVVILFYIGSITTTLRLCTPIEYNWNKTIPGHCGSVGEAEIAAAAINVVLDVMIVLLPLPVVWRLKMPTPKKIGVSVTFALGLSISAINLARIIKVLDCSLEDFTYCTRDSAILTVAEMAVGILVACIPTFGPVIFPRRFVSTSQRRYIGHDRDKIGSRTHTRLRGDQNDSFGGASLQGFERDEIELGNPLENGDSKSHISAPGDMSKPILTARDRIGVRKDVDIITSSQQS